VVCSLLSQYSHSKSHTQEHLSPPPSGGIPRVLSMGFETLKLSCIFYLPTGGHGVGWSEIPRYSFKVAAGWDETPVSIADLAGTELDLRFENKEEGNLFLVVAPVLRFRDVGVNADVRIDGLGTPDIIIAGFAPEIFGAPLSEDDVLVTETAEIDGITYYYWEVKPHHLVAATAVGNRLFMMVLNASGRQWRKAEKNLRVMQKSFFVPKI